MTVSTHAAHQGGAALAPEARRLLAAFDSTLQRPPPKPSALAAVIGYLQEPAASLPSRPMALRALNSLRAGLFRAPGREPEMELLWREALATACLARCVAVKAGFDAPLLTGAGLLHRAGEIVALRALAQAENETGQRFIGPVMPEILEARDDELVARVTRVWTLPGELRLLLRRWRAEQESPQSSHPVALLTLAQALATEVVHAGTCPPGLADAAREALRLPTAWGEGMAAEQADTARLLECLASQAEAQPR